VIWRHNDAMMVTKKLQKKRTLLAGMVVTILVPLSVQCQRQQSVTRQSIAVEDAIAMTRLGAGEYFAGVPSKGLVAHFSPDGKLFVVVLRKGNLDLNSNDFSLLLYHTADVFRSPKPDLLAKLSSSSNRNAITQLRWLDSRTLVFLGENRGELPQVCMLNVITRRLSKLTNHSTVITKYDVSVDGREVVFAAEVPKQMKQTRQASQDGIVIDTQSLKDLLRGELPMGTDLFVQRVGQGIVRIHLEGLLNSNGLISISPNRRYVLLGTWWSNVPKEWISYQDPYIRTAAASHIKGQLTDLSNLMLLDTLTGGWAPLVNAPNPRNEGFFPRFAWAPDGQAVSLKSFLPLDVADAAEREERSRIPIPVTVKLPHRELFRISDGDLRKKLAESETKTPGIEVTLEEDMNTPPMIYVTNPKTDQRALLLELNPQFAGLQFGKVVSTTWRATDGQDRSGGLFFPPDYEPVKRYPLVIQTHGFWKDRFSLDGSPEWSSAFAARMLAAQGFMVLQAGGIPVSGGPDEGTSYQATIEGAIDDLERRGLIDRTRVGIAGFSRTVYEVGYVLTHSKYQFKAAILADGITGGYFDYLVWGQSEEAALNGGPPFGNRLNLWLVDSPGFNLDKVKTPVRIVALGPDALLEMWEWFAGLKLQNKPVDFIELPDAVHLLERPSNRRLAMQSLVDWFRFWLSDDDSDRGEVDGEQNARWQKLRPESAPR
jgi:dipeptidyl aminopeptidase/acylaminoacyl peptidase